MSALDNYPALAAAAPHWRYQPKTDGLSGRTIVVTGAGDGIGLCLAKTAALYGANVVLLGRTRSKLEAAFDWIEQHTQTQPVIVPCDLELLDMQAAEALREAVASTYGRLDALVHNASLLGPKVPLPHYPYETWLKVMQTNINATFLLTQQLFDLLDAAPYGCVINTSSSVGRVGRAYWGAYAVSKFALEGFNQVLADENESAGHLHAFSLNPGGTRTGMRREAYPLEDPSTLPDAEQHMDLYLYLLEGPDHKPDFPATGSQLDARQWRS